jgi:hypothetical protein
MFKPLSLRSLFALVVGLAIVSTFSGTAYAQTSSDDFSYDYLGRLSHRSIYKFIDGDNTCYMVTNTPNKDSVSISCVKTK